jgi:hypothetical protein
MVISSMLLHLFIWSKGRPRFHSGLLPPEARTTVRLELENLFMEGAWCIKEWEHP